MTYIGRFAPSPTGHLHFGSLIAALGSFLDARANQGQWLVRIEDLDPPREMPGAGEHILQQLDEHGLHSDHPPLWQSHRLDIYQHYLQQLEHQNLVYGCDCPRRRIRELGGVYDGHCRNSKPLADSWAVRMRVEQDSQWLDMIQGAQCFQPVQLGGDFIVKRRDGLISYQLAVAVDDALQGITRVIRGADLLDSTARQKLVLRNLGFPEPQYGHLPMAMNADGQKLSKQTHARPLKARSAAANLIAALQVMGQQPPRHLSRNSVPEILQWGIAHWNLNQVPQKSDALFS